MSFVRIKDAGKSFSEQNPEVHLHTPYNALYKSLKKKRYDKVMMAIYLVYDPKSVSKRGNRKLEECKIDIQENYLKEPQFQWSKYSHIIEDYEVQSKSKIKIMLDELYKEINDRMAYGKGLSFEKDAKEKDRVLLNHDVYLDKYLALKAKVDEEEDVSTRAGNNLGRGEKRALKT